MIDEFVKYVDETLKRFDHELQKERQKISWPLGVPKSCPHYKNGYEDGKRRASMAEYPNDRDFVSRMVAVRYKLGYQDGLNEIELQKAKHKKEEEEKMELDIKNLDLETYTCKFELMRLRAELGETIDMLKAQIEQAQDKFEDGGEMDHDWVFRMKHRMAATKKVRRLAKVRIAVLEGDCGD